MFGQIQHSAGGRGVSKKKQRKREEEEGVLAPHLRMLGRVARPPINTCLIERVAEILYSRIK